MGADLISTSFWIHKDRDPDWEAARKTVNAMTEADLLDFADQNFPYFIDFDNPSAEQTKAKILEALDSIESWFTLEEHTAYNGKTYTVCPNWPAELATITVGPYLVHVGQGMSWGDVPIDEDVWNAIQYFTESPAAQAAGFFQE